MLFSLRVKNKTYYLNDMSRIASPEFFELIDRVLRSSGWVSNVEDLRQRMQQVNERRKKKPPNYRRNADVGSRELERRWKSTGDPEALNEYIAALFRAKQHPYWIRVREFMPRRDTPHYDSELISAERRWREAIEQDPNQDWVPEPELRLQTFSHPGGVIPWIARPASKDRVWKFYLHIPMKDGTEFVAWLGKMTGYESKDGKALQCTVESFRNLFNFDSWAQHPEMHTRDPDNLENETARSNLGLSKTLRNNGIAFHYKALMNIDVPLGWDPSDPILSFDRVAPLNECPSPQNPNRERPYNRNAQSCRDDEPPVVAPDGDFYITKYLFNRFYDWLSKTFTEYGQILFNETHLLDPQLPTIFEGRIIDLHYWKAGDDFREIEGTDDPNAPVYQQHRFVYETDYRVQWRGDFSTRFYRYSHDPGYADPNNAIRASNVVPLGESPETHEEVRQKARERLQKKIDQLVEVANKYHYQVNLIEGKPGKHPPLSTWQAGMRYPIPGFVEEGKEPSYF